MIIEAPESARVIKKLKTDRYSSKLVLLFLDATVQTDVSLGTGYSLTYSLTALKLSARETG